MGTSLQVQPFASLINAVGANVPRLLINREEVGKVSKLEKMLGISNGFLFGEPDNYRDVAYIGDLQQGIKDFVKHLGWEKEHEELMK